MATGTFSLATGTIASTTIKWANVNNFWADKSTVSQATVTNSFATNFVAGKIKGTGSTQLGINPTVFDSVIPNAGLVPNAALHIDAYSGMSFKTQGDSTTISLPAPTDVNEVGKIYLINNVGTNTLKTLGLGGDQQVIRANESRQFVWTGSAWSPTVGNLARGGTNTYTIRKNSIQATTLNTLQNDSALTFPIASGEKWFVQVNYEITQTGGAQAQVGFANSATGATCNYAVTVIEETNSTNACGTALTTNLPANTAILGALTADTGVVSGIFTAGTTGGNVTFQFSRQGAGGTNVSNQAESHLIAFRIDGADLAEVYFAKDSSIEEGDVVALDGSGVSQVSKSSKNYQKNVLGIISTKPGLVMGEVDGEGKAVVVGLSGRVPVKVTTKNGNVKAGDFLTASDIPGVAMRATGAGQVIGQALTDYNNSDVNVVGKVMVFIKNTYHDGNSDDDTADTIADKFTALVKNTLEKLSGVTIAMNLWVSELKATSVTADNVVAEKTVVKEFCVGSECFTEADMKEFRNYLNSKKPVETTPVEPTIPAETTTPVETPENIVSESPTSTETPVETPVVETVNVEVSEQPTAATDTVTQ
jgi:hypothetical protein